MKENLFFDAKSAAIEKQNKKETTEPLTSEFHDQSEKLMTHRDFFASMKSNIQEKIQPSEEELSPEQIKTIQELISPELMFEYKKILLTFKKKAVKNEEHPQRKIIDVEDEELKLEINQWVEKLKEEIKHKNTELKEDDFADLEMLSVSFFDSMATVFNTKSLELDIKDFAKESGIEYSSGNNGYRIDKIAQKIQTKYGISQAEAEILTDLSLSENKQYSLPILLRTLTDISKDYNLSQNKKQVFKISSGYLASKVLASWAPSTMSGLLKDSSFDVSVLFEYYFGQKASELLDARTEQELNTLMHDMGIEINKRITDSLFYQEFEFIHESKMGEIFNTLENGKSAILSLVREFISEFAPTCVTIGASLGFLSKINPILGGLGLASLPVTYKVAKNQHEKISGLYQSQREREEDISDQMSVVKTGFEEVRISPNMKDIAGTYQQKLNERDGINLERDNKVISAKELFRLPYDATTIGTIIVSYILQQKGEISSGAIISNLMYSGMLQHPINSIVNQYFNSFSYHVYDIQKMNKLFGEYEKFDVPEGQKESERISVSQLSNFDITIENLSFKNIIKGLSLEIKQGEFITICGQSGAGKTTVLRNISGLYKPDKGEIKIGGYDVGNIKRYGDESLYSAMSYCNQSPIIFDTMTLRDNLTLWAKEQSDDKEIEEVLKKLHLEKYLDKLDKEAKYLSGGERVRIGVARMLLKNPKIMLFDEPTASLDSGSSEEVRKIITELHRSNADVTIICVSHDQALIQAGDRSIEIL